MVFMVNLFFLVFMVIMVYLVNLVSSSNTKAYRPSHSNKFTKHK